ncbi:MAG TPA: tetratricopeptide repeat protein [Pirellulales bacterium]|nr:tetratricopeptide repeat protein [Pirellulales bacterium]
MLALLLTAPAAAADDDWIGAQVLPKETARPRLDKQVLKWNDLPLPCTVEQVQGDWLWVKTAWVLKSDVLTLDQAPAYYTELMKRVGEGKSVVYALRGISWLLNQEYVNASRDFDEAVRLEPGNASYHHLRGKSLYLLHKYDDALAEFNESIRLAPSNLVVHNDRAVTWNALGEHQRANQELRDVLRTDPNNALAYSNLGANWYDQGEDDKALDALNNAIRLDPKFAGAYCNRGRVLTKKGDYPTAVDDFQKAMKLAPREWYSYHGWARVLATAHWPQLRDGPRAKQLAERSCELSRWNEWHAIATLAAAEAELGNYETAMKLQTKAMAMSQPAKERDQLENEKRMACYKAGKAYYDDAPAEAPGPPEPVDASTK